MKMGRFQLVLIALLTLALASCSLRGKLPFSIPTSSPVPTIPPTPSPSPSATTVNTATPSPTSTLTPTLTPLVLYRTKMINVTYCTMDEVPLRLDIYMPDTDGPWPVVLFLHGGGWRDGDKSQLNSAQAAQLLNPLGYVVASANYRLYPDARFPAMIEDAKCAVRFMRANATKYNLNTDHIVAWGASAGGHLAALLGTTDPSQGWDVGEHLNQSSKVQAVVDVSGPADLTLGFKTFSLRQAALNAFGIDKQLRLAGSPVTYVSPGDAPFLILNGDKDPLIPIEQGQAMYNSLVQAGVSAQLIIVKNGVHNLSAYDSNPTSPTQDELRQLIIDFIAQISGNQQAVE